MSLVFKGFPCSSDGKESEMQETQVWSLGWEDPWRKEWQPTLVFVPENSMDRGAWQAIVHGVAKSRTGLSDFHFQLATADTKARVLRPNSERPRLNNCLDKTLTDLSSGLNVATALGQRNILNG